MYDVCRITVSRERGGSGFIVISESVPGHLFIADGLCYDEMLGYVARLFCPVEGIGSQSRNYGKPLFLEAPPKATEEEL